MIRPVFTRIPLPVWAAGCGVSAFIAAAHSADLTTAIWATVAILAMLYTLGCAITTHRRYRHARADCEFHHWARNTRIVIRDQHGSYWQFHLDELRHAGDLLWDAPAAAAVYNTEWLVKKEERRPHGRSI